MASDHLVFQTANDIFRGKSTDFCSHLAVKNDLVQKIAEFLADSYGVSLIEGVEEFVAFLKEERLQRFVALFFVPRTSVIAAELSHDIQQLGECFPSQFMLHDAYLLNFFCSCFPLNWQRVRSYVSVALMSSNGRNRRKERE